MGHPCHHLSYVVVGNTSGQLFSEGVIRMVKNEKRIIIHHSSD